MLKNLSLLVVFLFITFSFSKIFAQKKSKAEIGKLFISTPASITITPNVLRNSRPSPPIAAVTRSANRTIDGKSNNLTSANWGSAGISLLREIPAAYANTDRNNALNGASRPSARKISNVLVDEPVTFFNARGLSTFVYIWGQFLDHDMTLTPTASTESVPILLPSDDTIFTQNIPFTRSAVYPGTGTTTPREQMNLNTAWIDGSTVYGVDDARAKWLRTMIGGKMKVSAGNLLPWNTITGQKNAAIDLNAPGMKNDGNHTIKTFVAGDVRAAEHPNLTSMHTLFVREHNRICDALVKKGMTNDEQIYQAARKQIGAMIQSITYNEFLPALGINILPYSGYKPSVRPDLTNVFATAGYRLGHTMVADEILLFDNSCQPLVPEAMDLVEIFWNPSLIETLNVEPLFKGAAAHTQYETNILINSVLRNFLFGNPNDPIRFGVDLAALNIQRGRDHGLPDYNTIRKFYTGTAAASFNDITTDPLLANNLKNLYGNVNNIDAWTGVLIENLVGGTSVGKTVQAILKWQFEKLRDGDFYFFENDSFLPIEDRNYARNSKLSDIIKRNSKVTNIQQNVFFTLACPGFTPTPAKAVQTISEVENIKSNIQMYPNPVNDMLNINLGNQGRMATVRIFSSNGMLIKNITTNATETTVRINTSNFAKGLYYISISTGKNTKQISFIKL